MLLVKSYCILNPKCVFAIKMFSSLINTKVNSYTLHLHFNFIKKCWRKVSVSKKPQKKLENGTRQTKPLCCCYFGKRNGEKFHWNLHKYLSTFAPALYTKGLSQQVWQQLLLLFSLSNITLAIIRLFMQKQTIFTRLNTFFMPWTHEIFHNSSFRSGKTLTEFN